MKQLKLAVFLCALIAGIYFLPSCKGKDKAPVETTTTNQLSDTPMTGAPAPVQISPDDSLTTMARDAVKDFPGVMANVQNGEVTLTGSIKRDNLKALMGAVSAMHPKKINNNLTIN